MSSEFDDETVTNIKAAFSAVGADASLLKNLDYYADWFEGEVYSFTYKSSSVVDMFLYDDGRVFSIETNGVQIYLEGYVPFKIGDYLGAKTHFDGNPAKERLCILR